MTNPAVSQEIFRQLGGNKFCAMTGAVITCYSDDSISFRIGRNSKGVNWVSITLNAMDLYNVTYKFVRAGKATVKATSINVYADKLRSDFTEHTGLYTSL